MNSGLLRHYEATAQIAAVEVEALREILNKSIEVIASYHGTTIERWQLPIDLSFVALVIARVLKDGAIVDVLHGDLHKGFWFESDERSTNSGDSECGDSCWGGEAWRSPSVHCFTE